MKSRTLRLSIAVALAAMLLVTVAYAAGITRLDRVVIRDLTVTGDSTLVNATTTNLTTDETVTAGTSVTAGTYLESTTFTEVGTFLLLDAATSITVTDGVTFTALASWQPIAAAGEVTPAITIPAAGTVLCVENASAQTVNIADTGNQVLTAAMAMGQYDVLCMRSDGTRLIETSRANN